MTKIAGMMRRMRRNCVVGMLVICWVILSGMDLLEDLKHLRDKAVFGSSSSSERSSSKSSVRPFVNNILEFAHRPVKSSPLFLIVSGEPANALTAFSFRGYFLRHKFYRVFLI